MDARILVVDDNLINQKVVVKMIDKLGFTAESANGGEQAIQLLQNSSFDLVLMDCNMPGLSGYETTRIIRSSEINGDITYNGSYSHLPILALTADAMAGTRDKCIDAGMDDFLTKPVDIFRLGETIGRYIASEIEMPSSEGETCRETKAQTDIDKTVLDGFRSLTNDKFRNLMKSFISDTPVKIQGLKLAVENEDYQTIISISHLLAGSFAFLGANKASSLCKLLEETGYSKSIVNSNELINVLETAYQDFSNVLKEYL